MYWHFGRESRVDAVTASFDVCRRAGKVALVQRDSIFRSHRGRARPCGIIGSEWAISVLYLRIAADTLETRCEVQE